MLEAQSQTEAVRTVGELGDRLVALVDVLQDVAVVDRVGEHVSAVDRTVLLRDHRVSVELFRFCHTHVRNVN